MIIKTVRIDDETKAVLLRARIDGNRLHLIEQLTPQLYHKVDKAIKAAGGKWQSAGRGRPLTDGCHIFPGPVLETMGITADTVEVVDVQQTYQSFYTPPEVASQVIQWANIEDHHRVLEPSAGEGALLRAMPCNLSNTTAIELNETTVYKLPPSCHRILADFLEITTSQTGLFDRVIMNPPFTGGQDIQHIQHAIGFLKPGGRLVAICGNGPKQQEALAELADQWIDVPAGAFKSSGTGVATAIIVINN